MKTMCKRTLAFLLCALLLCGALPFAASAADVVSGACGERITWELNTNTGKLMIRGTGRMDRGNWKNYSYWHYKSSPWYSYRTSVQTVEIGSGITTIAPYAFQDCTRLTAVTIPNSVTEIGESAFYGCTSLKNAAIPSGVTEIGDSAFAKCTSISSVTIPSGVTGIGDSAFFGCTGITDVTIMDSAAFIDDWAFGQCGNLTSVSLGRNVSSIGSRAFTECHKLTSITIPDSVTTIRDSAFAHCEQLASITLPDGLRDISWLAFEDNAYSNNAANWTQGSLYIGKHLIAVKDVQTEELSVVPGTLDIANGAFENCGTVLKRITIPGSVVCIGDVGSFNYNCHGISYYSVDADNPVYCSDENGVIYSKDKTTLIAYPAGYSRTDFRIPNGVTTIDEHAVAYSRNLTSITIPESVTTIKEGAFAWCESLTSVEIPESVTVIGEGAFSCCTNLADVTLPDSVVCNSDGGTYPVFWGTALYENEENWTDGVLYIGNHLIAAKKTLAGMYSVREGTRSIEASAFSGCQALTGITIPDGVTVIGCGTFLNCDNLAVVSIPNSVTIIGDKAFCECASLANLTIPDSVTTIGESAFEQCAGLTNVTIPNGVTNIGDEAFWGCESLASVTIPDGVTEIGNWTFENCKSLSWAHIPRTVTAIDHEAFNYCSALQYICSDTADCYAKTYAEENGIEFHVCDGHGKAEILSGSCGKDGDNVTWEYDPSTATLTIRGTGKMKDYTYLGGTGDEYEHEPEQGDYAPWYAEYAGSIQTVVIENGVTSIGKDAFHDCRKMTTVTIADSVTSIGESAFFYCRNLANVTLPDSVTSIGYAAFGFCESLGGMSIGAGVTNISDYAFPGCTSMTAITVDSRNPAYSSDSGVLFDKEKTSLMCCPSGNPQTAYSIPNGVTSISDSAFMDCTNLTRVTIPGSVTRIGVCAFSGCTNLADVTLGNGVTSLGMQAFSRCESLTNITLPDSVTTIDPWAFAWCTRLAGITIPSGMRSIGSSVFSGCTSLAYAHIPSTVTSIADNAFDDCSNLKYICSNTAACYAKTFANKNGVEFRVCDGNHLLTLPQHPQSNPNVKAECDDDAFDVPVSLLAEPQERASDDWQKYEFDLSLRIGDEKMQAVYLIRAVDENGDVVQPNAGHPVTLHIPIPAGCNIEKSRIAHLLDDQGTSESFKKNPTGNAKPFTVSADGKYFIIEVTSFSPFIVFEEQSVSIKLQDTKKTLPFGEKRVLTLDVEDLPDGAKIVWTADNERVELKPSDDGRTCEVSAKKNGKVTVTATVVDKDGKPIEQDGETVSARVDLKTKANFFHKLFFWIFRIPWPFGK